MLALQVCRSLLWPLAVLVLQVCKSLQWLCWCFRCADHYCGGWCCRSADHCCGCVGVAGLQIITVGVLVLQVWRSLLWLCWCCRCADHYCGCVGVAGVQITSGAQSPDPDGYTAEWKAPKLPAKKVSEFRLVYKKVRPQSNCCFVTWKRGLTRKIAGFVLSDWISIPLILYVFGSCLPTLAVLVSYCFCV